MIEPLHSRQTAEEGATRAKRASRHADSCILEPPCQTRDEHVTGHAQIVESEQLIRFTMTWSVLHWACEGTNPDVSEDGSVPTAECIQDTKRRQLATRSSLQRVPCCVGHLLHKQAMTAPATVRQFFKTVLQQVQHFKVDVIAGDAKYAAAYRYYKNVYQDLYNSSVAVMLRETQREVITGCPFESRRHADYYHNNHFSQIRSATDLDCCFMAILSRENHLDREI